MINFVIGLLISIVAIMLFYGYVIVCIRYSGAGEILRQVSRKEWCFLLTFFAISALFVAHMMEKNQFIYYWDYSLHWVPTFSMAKTLFEDPYATMQTVWNTIGTTDYNWVMPLLYVLPAKLFGAKFEIIAVFVHILYMCPAFLIISICVNKYLKLAGYEKTRIFLYAVLAFAMPLVEYVLLKGFWDAPVLMLSACLLLLASDFEYKRFEFGRSTLMVIGILAIVLFRRHWAYWIIGYIFFLGIGMLFQLRKDKLGTTIKYFFENMVYIGGCCLLLLAFPFRPFLKYSLRNYEGIYAAWNTDIAGKINNINEAFGNFLILAILGILLCIWKNRKNIKFFIQNIVIILIPIIIMMCSVDMHDAHFYFVVVPILICLAISMECVWDCLKSKVGKCVTASVFGVFVFYNFLACFWSGIFLPWNNKLLQTAFCNLRYEPMYREDIGNIRKIVDYLNEKTEEYRTDVYLCASSHNINSHILYLAYSPEETNCVHHILPEANIDLVDGFNTNFFEAGIVVTEDFVDDGAGYITRGNEGVMVFLREALEDPSTPIGRHYEKMDEFSLNYKYASTVQVWRKVSEYETSDYEWLINYYDEEFADYQDLFSNRIREYMLQ